MNAVVEDVNNNVNCRIGSLENRWLPAHIADTVNCRIGSLEMMQNT